MFKPENKIIIVDDIQTELDTLSKEFYLNGLACTACLYDAFFSDPFTGVRIAFFDIDINPSGGKSESQIFNSIATAIRQYISLNNGPFALIFWTKNKSLITHLIQYIHERYSDIPKPFLVTYIDKEEFLDGSKSLQTKLEEILDDKILKTLLEFEQLTSQAATKTINQIFELIDANDEWGKNENFTENFEKVFSRIAIQSLGFNHAKENPDKAVYEALIPMLSYQVLDSRIPGTWKALLTNLATSDKSSSISKLDDIKESKLNSIFHVDASKLKNDTRGVVLNMDKSKKRTRAVFDRSYSDWVKSFVSFKKEFKEQEKIVKIREIDSLIKNSKLIAIEISAACDFQQNKHRLNKYLYGVLFSPIDEKLIINQVPDSSMKVGLFYYENREVEIWVNFNFVFGALPIDKKLGPPMFLFKKEMMDMIGNRYANHVSRIGITSF